MLQNVISEIKISASHYHTHKISYKFKELFIHLTMHVKETWE